MVRDQSQQRLELVAVVGRFALHIFDKTHRTWLCSIKELAYQHLAKGLQEEDEAIEEEEDLMMDEEGIELFE